MKHLLTIELLLNTTLYITNISYEVGFNSISYYTETFYNFLNLASYSIEKFIKIIKGLI